MNQQNPLNAFVVDAPRKNRSGRRKKKLRDIIKLGKGSEVIVRPTTKSSEEAMGEGEIKEENNIFALLRRERKRKPNDGKLIRRNMKASGLFPPLQPVAMSENDLKCAKNLEAEAAERRDRNKRTWAACKRALGREKEIYKFRTDDELTRGDE
jgi:hypothetical protein